MISPTTTPSSASARAMNVGVLRFPGSNCDDDARHAFADVLGATVRLIWHLDTDLGDGRGDDLGSALGALDAVVLPGGFAYGDYLRSGALAALSPIMTAVEGFADDGGLVLGICNGFQVLTEGRMLPGQLARNTSLSFRCHDVHLRVERDDLPFTSQYRRGQVLRMPIAHNEGRYHADARTLARLEEEGRVVFRYTDANGEVTPTANVNGSCNAIAGITNERGNVLGMMPHPERAVEPLLGYEDGLGLLRGMLVHAEGRRSNA